MENIFIHLLLLIHLVFSKRSPVVPGSGCGVTRSVKILDRNAARDLELSSGSDADCAIAPSQETLVEIVKQVEVLKCIQGQMDCADMQYNVLANPSTCADLGSISVSDTKSGLEDIPDCAIMEKGKFEGLVADKIISSCPDGDPACLQSIGYTFVKLSPFCGASKPNELHDKVPFSWAGHLCVILPYELRDQEIRIVLQNMQAGQDIEYDKWDTLTSIRLDDEVKDLWNSFSNSIWTATSTPGQAHDKVINSVATHCYIVDNVQDWLQIEFEQIYHVTRVVMEGRKDGCCPQRFAYIEVRVGMVDTEGLPTGLLTSNQVCYTGGNDYADGTTKDYKCPKPLRGKFLTTQKTQVAGGNYIYTICEVYVDVIDL